MLKKILAALTSLVLGTVVVATTATAANAVSTPPCVVDEIHHPAVEELSHQEYRYKQVTPGEDEVSHTEYRFRTRTVTSSEKERKFIYSTWSFVDGGTTTINGKTVSGHWQNLGGSPFWHEIAESVINAYWTNGNIDDSLLGGSEANPKGTVPLSVYGAPGGAGSPQYYAFKESSPSGYTDWGPWSGWSTTDPGAETETKQVESKKVVDSASTPDVTVYYVKNGTPSDDLTDANWTDETLQEVGEPWTLVDERKVVDRQYKPGWTEPVYGDCVIVPPTVSCLENVEGTTLTLPEIPGVLWKVDGGTPAAGPVVVQLTLADVTIEAVPAPGYVFSDGQTSWTFEADENGVCQFPTLANFPTNATWDDEKCMLGNWVPGSVTVGQIDKTTTIFAPWVDYYLDGSQTPMTTQKVVLAPGPHTVVAQPRDPDDSLTGETFWEFTIEGVDDEVCGDIPTLPLTGGSGSALLSQAGLLLLCSGLALVAMRSRRSGFMLR